MVLKIVLLLTIIFQIIAAIVSLKLTKKTKYNLSWVFISLGFAALLMRMILEALPVYFEVEPKDYRLLYLWLGVASAIFFAIGLILIRKIFIYMAKMEREKRASEKKYLSVMIQAEDNERKRLAKDLHDGLGPLLSTIKMSLSALKKQKSTPQYTEILNNLDNVILESIKSIRDISNNLNPHVLDNFGLDKAINNFLQKISTTGGISIDYRSNLKDLRLEQNTESVLYRVLCELINNTLKHANAKKISINLYYDIYSITLNYKDDGKGFEVDNLFKPQEKGTGLYNIYSRINSLKGKIDIQSSHGSGTDVEIKIPFGNDDKE
ncbi:MAG TPA: sensor histidine kinase [Bacteroidales bacterium]|nr:sensor histidine kinase [Bacteroidales bacterium]HOZ30915.1 sensor histidine kinase [Bacteroidales bacterium]